MARTIKEFPIEELRKDLQETLDDIMWCQFAMRMGETTYGNGNQVSTRLGANQQIKAKIEAELKRRREKVPEL